MSYISYGEFANACSDSGAAIQYDLLGEHRLRGPAHLPNDWYGAVAAAGSLLRQDPERELVAGILNPDLIGDSPTVAQMTLHGILNASVDRITGYDPDLSFFNRTAPDVLTCHNAEYNFGQTFDAMTQPDKTFKDRETGQAIGWTIITAGEEVVAVSKTAGEYSTVSLEQFVHNGIPYIKGSIYRVEMLSSIRSHPGQKLVVPVEHIARIGFMRMSALTQPPQYRAAVFGLQAKTLENWPIERIKSVAKNAIPYSLAV